MLTNGAKYMCVNYWALDQFLENISINYIPQIPAQFCLQKSTKNALETARTFATLFNDMELRARLLAAHSMESFKKYLLDHAKELASDQTPEGASRKASLIALPVLPVGLSSQHAMGSLYT